MGPFYNPYEGSSARIRLPQWYSEKVEGLCGNFDQEKENDWFLRNGTVLPYSDNSFLQVEAELSIASDWKYPGEQAEPPLLDDIQRCAHGEEFVDIEKSCEEFFDEEILKSCTEVFDPKDYINACIVDFCANPEPKTKRQILRNYIHDCIDMRDDNELKCSWFNTIPGLINF